MRILYIGDIYGQPGIDVVGQLLPKLKADHAIDLVIAQGENVSDGRGLLEKDMQSLQAVGIDCFTGGNWSLFNPEALPLLENPNIPVIRPANYPRGTPGKGWTVLKTPHGEVLVISLLGSIVGRDAYKAMDNPLKVVDSILDEQPAKPAATIVNLHGDFSSEKVIIGHYLDGRATLVVGDHWHIPTADARLLPKGTAHISDVGMVGTLNSSLGVKLDVVIPRWRDDVKNRNQVETAGPRQFNAVLVEANKAGLASSVELIRRIIG